MFEPLKVALSLPSGEKIDIIAEKSVISNFKVPQKNLPLVERSDLYKLVQLVEYYQKILVTYLDHSGNGGGGPLDGVSGGIYMCINSMYEELRVCTGCIFTTLSVFMTSRNP